ncbi:DNA polymerase III subunit epsilon [Geothermobacter hydrogeniphilus]|uniref:DNA polymerase III subunit epsilon n=2 Tax=Geothermobacter hydrogeniphilus TaxID=1969733 RepID=A0A2K2HDQ3_9BACT|nr:DNA polymerase III subunit epsilon [Geothermobacter hydrogeniphilus]
MKRPQALGEGLGLLFFERDFEDDSKVLGCKAPCGPRSEVQRQLLRSDEGCRQRSRRVLFSRRGDCRGRIVNGPFQVYDRKRCFAPGCDHPERNPCALTGPPTSTAMKPIVKYWLFLLAVVLIMFSVILGSFLASWYHLSGEEQQYFESLSDKLVPYPILGAITLCLIIGGLVSLLFHFYIIPILRLGEETKLISIANPEHRIEPKGAKEVVQLAHVINESAEAYQKLQTEVREQIDKARAELHAERNRLAALMSELPNGVLVCNTDGLVLLYNTQAQKLLQQPDKLVGLGRSIFAVLDREPIIHGLDVLQNAVRNGQKAPTTHFVMTVHDNLSLRVNMAPVFDERSDQVRISGFVLAMEDMTGQLSAELQRDALFQTLTEAMRYSTGEIRSAILTILSSSEIHPDELNNQRQIIDRASEALEEQLLYAKDEYARHLVAPSKTENILAADLLELIRRHMRERLHMPIKGEAIADLWLRTGSYTVLQGISQLTGQLQKHPDLAGIEIRIREFTEQFAALEIHWSGCRLDIREIKRWQRRPLIRDARDRMVSVVEVIERAGGQVQPIPADAELCEGVMVTLSKADPETHFEEQNGPEHRPIYYEFDLFHQPGWQEMGQMELRKLTYVVFDTETTGLSPSEGDEIIQIGAVRIVNGRILYDETIDQLVDPRRHLPQTSIAIHGIQPEMLRGQPTIETVLPQFHHFCEGSVLVAHNAAFDMKFLQMKEELTGLKFDHPVIDTLLLSWVASPHQDDHNLDAIAKRFGIPIVGRHTALGDALVTAEVLVKLIALLESKGINTLEEVLMASAASPFNKLKF